MAGPAPLRDRDNPFLYLTCQLGAEPALKKEIAREHPDLRFAFSRPGFVTFKWAGDAAAWKALDFEPRTVFGRTAGVSLGRLNAQDPDELVRAIVAELPRLFPGNEPVRLHVWERDLYRPDEEPPGFEAGRLAAGARHRLLDAGGGRFAPEPKARDGETVLDVVIVEPDEWWVGLHRQRVGVSPWPGARPPITVPPESPSRAFRKLEEALHWSGAPLRRGDIAVEVGSAPGGASYALLQRGLQVVGIDPGEMDERLLRDPNFIHIARPVNSVAREELPERVDWLLLDINVAPSVSLFALDRLAHRTRDSLLGLLLTVKLNQWKIADEIPGMLEHVQVMGEGGMARVRATQLPGNRQEFFIYALTRRGARRQ